MNVFDEIDNAYISTFPKGLGWEAAAVGILLSYEDACSQNPGDVDQLKYGAMHALRWGRLVASEPLDEPTAPLPLPFLHACDSARRLGNAYVGVFNCRKLSEKGVFHLEESSTTRFRYSCDSNWYAFDLLDRRLSELEAPADDATTEVRVRHVRDELLAGLQCESILPDFFRNRTSTFQQFVSFTDEMYDTSFRGPSNWTYRGASLCSLRRVWSALGLLALVHGPAVGRCQYAQNDPRRLLLWRRSDLVAFLHEICDEPADIVRVAIDGLTYSRELSPPDIALQPFVAANDEWLAASPWMVVTSNLERNFLAVVARCDSMVWNNSSSEFAAYMGQELANWCISRGYRAAPHVPLNDASTSEPLTDLDLIIWSPGESFLVTAELRWMIQPADVMEILNRGEKECRQKLEEQLPKHVAALSADAAAILSRAFHENATVEGHDSLLVCRGFVGTSRLPTDSPCVDERLLRWAIESHQTLRGAIEWLRSREWLPCPGQHFRVKDLSIETPNGVWLTYPNPTTA